MNSNANTGIYFMSLSPWLWIRACLFYWSWSRLGKLLRVICERCFFKTAGNNLDFSVGKGVTVPAAVGFPSPEKLYNFKGAICPWEAGQGKNKTKELSTSLTIQCRFSFW